MKGRAPSDVRPFLISPAKHTAASFCYIQSVAYPERFIIPMREDLTRFGVEEARTPEDVDRVLASGGGTVLMVVNSVCGCAAGKARPAIGMALTHKNRPQKAATVFAGGDVEATDHLRGILADFPPSSPSMALFRDGKPVFMLHRSDIERRDAMQIAKLLTDAFDNFCAPVHSATSEESR
jgi:putative YphP/YqiW family bacilliredoxin